jgi:ElaB/YqjD/DUF883 family membrane-anchored ribosome-binding protein
MKQINDASKALKNWGKEAQERVGDIRERVEDISEKVGDQVGVARAKTKRYVVQNPEKSLLMAAGVGLAVGTIIALIFRGRNRD